MPFPGSVFSTFGPVTIPGGAYTAEINPEGVATIRDVPFFAELPANERSNPVSIGREWMEKVVERHRELADGPQQHLAPVHANHHNTGDENFRVGFLRPTRVGQTFMDGEMVWTLFGDILHVKPEHFQQIKDLRFPYRSAQISPTWAPEISSLALMEHRAPHFKTPMLTIGEERFVNFSEDKQSLFVGFHFGEQSMAATPKDPKKKTDKDSDGVQLSEQIGEQLNAQVMQNVSKVLEEFTAKLPEVIKAQLDALLPAGARDAEGEVNTDPRFQEQVTTQFAAMTAKIDGLLEKDRKREERFEAQNAADKAAKTLEQEGYTIPESVRANLETFASQGEAVLEAFVSSYRTTAPKDPVNFESMSPDGAHDVQDPEEVLAFQSQGPEKLELARQFSREYDELISFGADLENDRQTYIELQMEFRENEKKASSRRPVAV